LLLYLLRDYFSDHRNSKTICKYKEAIARNPSFHRRWGGFHQFHLEIDGNKKNILIILFILSNLTYYNRIHSNKLLFAILRENKMKIYVCVKHVPDSAAKITIVGSNRIDESVTFLMNPYDEHAIEEAARLKKQVGGVEVIAVSVGKTDAANTIQSALAMGADRGILVTTDSRPDSLVTARALKAAIEQDGQADIIFTGKESIDSEGFQTMHRLAAAMDMPAASGVESFALEPGRVRVECDFEAGAREVIEMSLPCVIGCGKGLNKPSYPTLPAIIKARKKEVQQIDLQSLNIGKPAGSIEILELKTAVEEREPQEIKGAPEEIAGEIARILREEAKIITER
jgi:electron transfer flavoprotein beta subunit